MNSAVHNWEFKLFDKHHQNILIQLNTEYHDDEDDNNNNNNKIELNWKHSTYICVVSFQQ